MEPETLVEERLRSCRDEREESCEGRDERLRNMLGRDTEMTLSCGEHAMPCHEHGVGLDGFHEERTEEDALKEGSVVERRERRAFPSAEREETSNVLVIVR
jgi:hypothetical protein